MSLLLFLQTSVAENTNYYYFFFLIKNLSSRFPLGFVVWKDLK